MKLYDLELSGNCYKVRLFAALNGIQIDLIPVDFLGGMHKQSPVIDLNPWGELPVLDDSGTVLRDSHAILIYLAKKYSDSDWYGKTPEEEADIQQWLSVSSNEVQNGPCSARLVDKFGYTLEKQHTLNISDRILGLLEAHLAKNEWLSLDRPTIADCAVMPYVALAPEGGVSLDDYPSIQAWITRIKALPGFIPMPGV